MSSRVLKSVWPVAQNDFIDCLGLCTHPYIATRCQRLSSVGDRQRVLLVALILTFFVLQSYLCKVQITQQR